MTYKEYTEMKQKEVNELPLHFAFSQEQLNQELEKMGCTRDDIVGLGFAGAFVHKKDKEAVLAYFSKKDPITDLMQNEEFAVEAFYYEMCNHEYAINWQADWDVCACFCEKDPEYAEEKTYVEYLKEDGKENLIPFYRKAKEKYMHDANENEWF